MSNIYFSDLNPAPHTTKYADDTIIYSAVGKQKVITVHKKGGGRASLLPTTDMGTAAVNSVSLGGANHQHLNANNTQYM